MDRDPRDQGRSDVAETAKSVSATALALLASVGILCAAVAAAVFAFTWL